MPNLTIDINAPVITRDQILVHATPQKVWDILTDINNWSSWNKDINSAKLAANLDVNNSFTWTTAGMEITSTIAEIRPPSKIAWSGEVSGIMGIHEWHIEPAEDGAIVRTL